MRSPCSGISPPCMSGQPADRLDQCGLADAIAPDNDYHFAARELKFDAVQYSRRSVPCRTTHFERRAGASDPKIDLPHTRVVAYVIGRVLHNQLRRRKHRHVFRIAEHEVHVMLNEQDRGAAVSTAKLAEEFVSLPGRKPGRRLVKQQELRLQRQRQCDLQQALLAIRQRFGRPERASAETEFRQQRAALRRSGGFSCDRT